MAKPQDDLYGDIYADEFQEFLDDVEQNGAATTKAETADPSSAAVSASNHADVDDDGMAPAPLIQPQPIPTSPDTASSASRPGNLSYSAQIAQQFSSYKQTPSQERQQRALGNGGAATPTPDGVFGKKPSEMHDAGKMFIGGLSWDTTDEGLRDYFEKFGKVDACTIMRDPSGTSRGFAFLTFEDPNVVEAVTKATHFLDGKSIDPKRAIPHSEHLRNTRFFVGGLSHSTTPETMKAFFASYGKVVDATVMMDKETGRSKGFGFITFEDVGESLNSLVGKVGLMLDDKEIELRQAQARNARDQTRNLVNKTRESSTPDSSSSHNGGGRLSLPTNLPNGFNPFSALTSMNTLGAMNGGGGSMNGMGVGMNMNGMVGMNNGAMNPALAQMMMLGNRGMAGAAAANGGASTGNPGAAGNAGPMNMMMNPMMAMMGMGMGMPGAMNMGMMQQFMANAGMSGMNGMGGGGAGASGATPMMGMAGGMAGMGGMGGMRIPSMGAGGIGGMQAGGGMMMNNRMGGGAKAMQTGGGAGPMRNQGGVRKTGGGGFHPYSR